METALGMLGLVVFIAGVIAFAAAITYVVIKVTPAEKEKQAESAAS